MYTRKVFCGRLKQLTADDQLGLGDQVHGEGRNWLRGSDKVRERYYLTATAHNVAVLMRDLFRVGCHRRLQQFQLYLEAALSPAKTAYMSIANCCTAFHLRVIRIRPASWL